MTRRTITDEELIAYAAGDLAGGDPERIEDHLREHPDAARRVALYRLAAEAFAADDSVPAPVEAVERAKAIFRQRATVKQPSWLERVDAIIAQLVYDSRVQPAAVRRTGSSHRFQLSFETQDADVDLRAERLPHDPTAPTPGWRVMGQIDTGAPAVGLDVELAPADGSGPARRTRSDDHAMFALDVPAGAYDVRIRLTDTVIVLPNIEIR